MRRSIKISASLVLLAAGVLVGTADAQTARKPKPLATPPPVLTGAEIISRAIEDYEGPRVVRPDGKPAEQTETQGSVELRELRDRIKLLEATGKKNEYDEKQKRLLLNLDILTRAEQRSESLRKQMFEIMEKENGIRTRLEQIEIEMRPEMIERTLQLSGSMKPEEIREGRRKSLVAERSNLQSLMGEIQSTRSSLTASLQKADIMVDKLRAKLEKDIDDSFLKDDTNPQ